MHVGDFLSSTDATIEITIVAISKYLLTIFFIQFGISIYNLFLLYPSKYSVMTLIIMILSNHHDNTHHVNSNQNDNTHHVNSNQNNTLDNSL